MNVPLKSSLKLPSEAFNRCSSCPPKPTQSHKAAFSVWENSINSIQRRPQSVTQCRKYTHCETEKLRSWIEKLDPNLNLIWIESVRQLCNETLNCYQTILKSLIKPLNGSRIRGSNTVRLNLDQTWILSWISISIWICDSVSNFECNFSIKSFD